MLEYYVAVIEHDNKQTVFETANGEPVFYFTVTENTKLVMSLKKLLYYITNV